MGIKSLFSGVSGFESHNAWLDGIGKNIFNANHVSYKSGRLKFSEQLSVTLSTNKEFGDVSSANGSKSSGDEASTVSFEAVGTEGEKIKTGRNLDLSIQGEGFFVVQKGDQRLYTRSGNMGLDDDGNLLDNNGGNVQGVMVQSSGIPTGKFGSDSSDLGNIRVGYVRSTGTGDDAITPENVTVDAEGVLNGGVAGGATNVGVARIAIASFSNPDGLSKVEGDYYAQSASSGAVELGFAGEGVHGTIQSGVLEFSKGDFGAEQSNRNVAQRSYDSNLRTLGVTRDVWSEAVAV